jgi:hypothetical protein
MYNRKISTIINDNNQEDIASLLKILLVFPLIFSRMNVGASSGTVPV